ncbi:glycosyltransferase [Pseudofulvimonas gallinarii]|uniref:Glycosyltransferase involved in cell wall biosynthesis n=1 Tax=Pseudofulvimonas gallinarii TaxID=634155 RepID=A0A4R3LFF8_9GAMM|nr:glycosyltransferase [Pseudofulvimonas gallinarii]TCS98230.1 glycosyltransferase involved in cell wall biosynthesis [Pseudofulvimonas gallinarii]THD13794.1 glycosyltransferase [Pseudofulvimonas gallinarii]
MFSLIIPVYRNEQSIPRLLDAIAQIRSRIEGGFEAVFVVDGSPDYSSRELACRLPEYGFQACLVDLSRNFGSFAAIRAGLEMASGDHFAVMAADLQEPPELIVRFHQRLQAGDVDVVVGVRRGRSDPWLTRLLSGMFWRAYRKLVMPEIPPGGVDIFAFNRAVRDQLLAMREARSSLVAQLFWLGFRRVGVEYERLPRLEGKSAWGFRRKLDYLLDSLFAFSDLPIRLLVGLGMLSLAGALILTVVAMVSRLIGIIDVPGYTATLIVLLGFGGLNALGLGIVGIYAWRAYENTKGRALSVIRSHEVFRGREAPGTEESM